MTYSIVARDAETGELGVAVQSQAFNTGAAVPWARAGVGAVATQSFTDRRYGWRGLELLAAGVPPAWAAQANMVASPRVWETMGEAFETARGSLAQRLLASLDAAEAAGGDWRGRGGAGIVVVPPEGEPWERVIDLRVEEGDDSLERLRALVDRAEGYRRWNRASGGRVEIARQAKLAPPTVAWSPIADALEAGDDDEARRMFRELVAREPRWEGYARALDAHPELPSLARLFDD